jgi:GNAT superfamily N-acetyltransferase
VRAATVADARAILDVRARSWQVAYAHAFPAEELERQRTTAGQWVGWWEELIGAPTPRTHVVVGERTGAVVGFAHSGVARGEADVGVGELYAIYVQPDAWGGGVGQALMAETLARLRSEGFREAILWVLEDNPRTRRFYELAGWHADGGVQEEEWLGTTIREVRYRIDLR